MSRSNSATTYPPLSKGGRGDLRTFTVTQPSLNPPQPPFGKGGSVLLAHLTANG
jgi:hypothetical protein